MKQNNLGASVLVELNYLERKKYDRDVVQRELNAE